MDIEKLDDLYKLYRFQLLPISSKDVRVYSYTSKYFSNADIIIINKNIDSKKIDKLSLEVEALGFSTKVRSYKTIEEAEENLFDGFFDVNNSNKILYQSYLEYKEKIGKVIFGEYEYINSEYYDVENDKEKNDNIVDTILGDLELSGPVLIMLEAAAGFGKTSTSYEVIKNLSLRSNTNKVPLFTELSRNRQASIFKYVLYDEINRRFTGLYLELVNKQIIEGRIPVIIDGFDELLKAKSQERTEDKFEDAEPMLETIKELLQGDAKIIITTRRTAIFSDDDFFVWLDKNSNQFTFKRYSISSPTIRDWIPAARENELQKAGLNIKSISNPVLLAYLRSLDDDKFSDCVNDIDSIIEDYVMKLMEREKERQDLIMAVPEQKKILKIISKHFTNHDVTSEAKDVIEKKILDKEQKLMFDVLERYPSGKKPTVDQLINKLIIHAFLDRKGESGQQIGFVNDFILGTFVGENLLEENDSWIGTERFIDFVLTAYMPRSTPTKKRVYDILNTNLLEYLSLQKRVFIDNYLNGCINRNLENDYFSNLEFRQNFSSGNSIKGVIFSECEFHNISFNFENIVSTHFINCNFYQCLFPFDEIKKNKIQFTNCTSSPTIDFNKLYHEEKIAVLEEVQLDNYERKVLEKFWPTGKERFIPHRRPGTLQLGVPPQEVEDVHKAIDSLIKRKILIQRRGQHSLELNIEFINEIKKILGR